MKRTSMRILVALICVLTMCHTCAMADQPDTYPKSVTDSAKSIAALCYYDGNDLKFVDAAIPMGTLEGGNVVFASKALFNKENIDLSRFRIIFINKAGEYKQYGLADDGFISGKDQPYEILVTKSPVDDLTFMKSSGRQTNSDTVYMLDLQPSSSDNQTYDTYCLTGKMDTENSYGVDGSNAMLLSVDKVDDAGKLRTMPVLDGDGQFLGITYTLTEGTWFVMTVDSVIDFLRSTLGDKYNSSGVTAGGISWVLDRLSNNTLWIVAGVILVLIIISSVIFARKKKRAGTPAQIPTDVDNTTTDNVTVSDGINSNQNDSTMPTLYTLACLSGALQGENIKVVDKVVLGRDPLKADKVFPSETPGVSSCHCVVSIDNGQLTITDLGSKYGTYIGTRQLKPNEQVALYIGDRFTLGDRSNCFEVRGV